MKKLLFFSIICFSGKITFSQSSENSKKAELSKDPQYVEFLKRHDDITAKQNGQAVTASSYFGYDETLKSYFIGNSIPAETPKSQSYTSKTEYVKVLNEWISKNKNLLKSENKNSLITE